MKTIKIFFILSLFLIGNLNILAQYKWIKPLQESGDIVQGRYWGQELTGSYARLPEKAKSLVRKPLWDLSCQSAGLSIRFYSNAPEITVKYTVSGGHAMPHMPATGVSGLDLYSTDCHGNKQWCAGQYSFGDTLVYRFRNLVYRNIHSLGSEYQLFLPLYNEVTSLKIGTPESNTLSFIPVSAEKPIVIYGTSIAQGACASRPGMAWGNILQRSVESPVINLGFSGNGRLEKEMFGLLAEIDARLFIIDCMPNMTDDRTASIVESTLEGVKLLRLKSAAPILLVEHCGYMNDRTSEVSKQSYIKSNQELRKAYDLLVKEAVPAIYYLTKEEIGLTMDSQVDGVHASDLGMQQYADAYLKKVNEILVRSDFKNPVLNACKQRREPDNYEWNRRHEEILRLNNLQHPEILVVGNSIAHFWAGEPQAFRQSGKKAWEELFAGKTVRNLGCGWDRIENVLWRVYHGELDGYEAKKIFLMIGTNNLERNTNEEIVEGIVELGKIIASYQPKAQVYVVNILPRRAQEVRVKELNKQLAKSLSATRLINIDISAGLTGKDGKIDESLFLDGLHPNEEGYLRMAGKMKKCL